MQPKMAWVTNTAGILAVADQKAEASLSVQAVEVRHQEGQAR